MNKAKLKSYAPAARREFIQAVSDRAHALGLAEKEILPVTISGEVALIGGRPFPRQVAEKRKKLEARIAREGFAQVMEAVAYTWFDRFAALRFMELHDYLGHGWRVFSSRDGGLPEILAHAAQLDLPGLKKEQVIELKLDGNKDAELYRLLLVAQCNALSVAMPFLFERIEDETELLLPDNLLHSDSLIRKLVSEIDEEDWQQVEIIGWLYQFYISEKKDQVIGKVVKSEDIPAATQLFTPNWIVQYLVQNSVGRLWLMANPTSTLKNQWPYYIEPAEQTPEVNAQLDALIQTRMAEDGGSLNPESITVLDPACGSGHILVEAYEVLKRIYLERGYRLRDIPRLILEKNLFGLDIDDRAAQLASFALLMKARTDDRRLIDNPPQINVLALQESSGLDPKELGTHLQPFGIERVQVARLIDTFAHAKTFGSLIQIPEDSSKALPTMAEGMKKALESGDFFSREAAIDLLPLVHQAKILAKKFDAVVANPPYMGSKGMNSVLKDYAKTTFPDSKSDLFAMFMERGFGWCKSCGFNSMVTMQSWMFLSSYESMREKLLRRHTIQTMAHLGARAFSEISGEVVQTTAFTLCRQHFVNFKPIFFRLLEGQEVQKSEAILARNCSFAETTQEELTVVPGAPIAYWISPKVRNAFSSHSLIGDKVSLRQGLATGDNDIFLRLWHEVAFTKFCLSVEDWQTAKSSGKKWFPHNKGGGYRKWYGNNEWVIAFDQKNRDLLKDLGNHLPSEAFYFRPCISWSLISGKSPAFRYVPTGSIIGHKGPGLFGDENELQASISLLNSHVAVELLKVLSPTLSFEVGQVAKLPTVDISTNSEALIELAKSDWNEAEVSWDFSGLKWLSKQPEKNVISDCWETWRGNLNARLNVMKDLEEDNNRLFIAAYGLQDELTPEVSEDQIILARADREKDCQRLISYSIGCMMGRYSLDEPGLIYAHAGNIGFNSIRYQTFPADADGIVPITDELWFDDDAAKRTREFLLAVWGPETLEENLAWLAESLGKKGNETPEETIRRYLADKFYKDHMQTYKKRPIYWLFSSGKQKAFECLVYLHRYNEGTLARMRNEYVTPLQGKLSAQADYLKNEADAANSTAERNKLQKQFDTVKKKQAELSSFDDLLRHYADQRISLDLDDGVKVNYGKFGSLLAEVKAITGGGEE